MKAALPKRWSFICNYQRLTYSTFPLLTHTNAKQDPPPPPHLFGQILKPFDGLRLTRSIETLKLYVAKM